MLPQKSNSRETVEWYLLKVSSEIVFSQKESRVKKSEKIFFGSLQLVLDAKLIQQESLEEVLESSF